MDVKVKAVLLAVLENEMASDDAVVLAISSRMNAAANPSLCLFRERDRHFRLGHIGVWDEWIERYLEADFHDRFRMQKDTFHALVNVVQPYYREKMPRGDSPQIGVAKSVAITLWYLAHQMSMDDVGDRFGVALSSVYNEVNCIVDSLCALSSTFIVWPKESDCAIIEQQFRERAGFPGVIGAIDGCHIGILAPASDHSSYTDRKMNHSIILQGICTARKIFTNVSIGTPGSRNDCRALRYSNLFQRVTTEGHCSMLYEASYHLVGDKAYPIRSWLITPFKDFGNLTRQERNYNYKHSVTRVVIEHCFGLLKGRW